MHQLVQGRTGIVQQTRGGKGLPIGPMLLAFLAWFISVPSSAFGLFWCLRLMLPKSPAHLPISEFLAYPFYVILWIGSALTEIATVSHPLGLAAILLGLVSIFWPRTPRLVRATTAFVLLLSVVGSWVTQSRLPNPTFPF